MSVGTASFTVVGKVCFHLAENKNDSEYPFAFLTTYIPKVAGNSRLVYQPLKGALTEYASGRQKQALAKLLSPLLEAAKKSIWINELVESGDIYHPLAWKPEKAKAQKTKVQAERIPTSKTTTSKSVTASSRKLGSAATVATLSKAKTVKAKTVPKRKAKIADKTKPAKTTKVTVRAKELCRKQVHKVAGS